MSHTSNGTNPLRRSSFWPEMLLICQEMFTPQIIGHAGPRSHEVSIFRKRQAHLPSDMIDMISPKASVQRELRAHVGVVGIRRHSWVGREIFFSDSAAHPVAWFAACGETEVPARQPDRCLERAARGLRSGETLHMPHISANTRFAMPCKDHAFLWFSE